MFRGVVHAIQVEYLDGGDVFAGRLIGNLMNFCMEQCVRRNNGETPKCAALVIIGRVLKIVYEKVNVCQ